MSSTVIYLILINIIRSEIITCNDPFGCSWHCPANGRCDSNIYNCTSIASACNLKCNSCNAVQIFSSAHIFNIMCTSGKGCPNMQITTKTANNNIKLQCGSSSRCAGVTLNCPSNTDGHCQCIDNKQNVCTDQVQYISHTQTNQPSISVSISPTKPPSVYLLFAEETKTSQTKYDDMNPISVNITRIINVYVEQDTVNHNNSMISIEMVLICILLFLVVCLALFLFIFHTKKRKRKQTEIEVHDKYDDDNECKVNVDANGKHSFESSQLYIDGDDGDNGDLRTMRILGIPVIDDKFAKQFNFYNEGDDNKILPVTPTISDDEEDSVDNHDMMYIAGHAKDGGHNTPNGVDEDEWKITIPYRINNTNIDEESDDNPELMYIEGNKIANKLNNDIYWISTEEIAKSDPDYID